MPTIETNETIAIQTNTGSDKNLYCLKIDFAAEEIANNEIFGNVVKVNIFDISPEKNHEEKAVSNLMKLYKILPSTVNSLEIMLWDDFFDNASWKDLISLICNLPPFIKSFSFILSSSVEEMPILRVSNLEIVTQILTLLLTNFNLDTINISCYLLADSGDPLEEQQQQKSQLTQTLANLPTNIKNFGFVGCYVNSDILCLLLSALAKTEIRTLDLSQTLLLSSSPEVMEILQNLTKFKNLKVCCFNKQITYNKIMNFEAIADEQASCVTSKISPDGNSFNVNINFGKDLARLSLQSGVNFILPPTCTFYHAYLSEKAVLKKSGFAFLTGLHSRCGVLSPIYQLPPDVAKEIVELSFRP